MNIILMMKDKEICHRAYEWCESHKGINVVNLVAPSSFSVKACSDDRIYESIKSNSLKDIDLVVSFLYWKKIRKPLIDLPKLGCINFHPAPLPEFKGVAPYTRAIIENVSQWGATSHFIDENIDTGDIIQQQNFNVDMSKETSGTLCSATMPHLLSLFEDVMEDFVFNRKINRIKQNGGTYFSGSDFEKLRKITDDDSASMVERKTRAYWNPPFDGAYIERDDKQFMVVPKCWRD